MTKSAKYFYAVWRRKSSTAVVKLFPQGTGNFSVQNGEKVLSLKDYFGGNDYLYLMAIHPLQILWADYIKKFDANIVIRGGGIAGHADSIRLWFARALIELNPELRTQLKPFGLLKRDPRVKERKKPGLKKARKAPTRSKR